MAARRGRKKLMAEMNVVPYIDVMLVLLVIFMVTAPLLTQGVKVDLPQAAADPVDQNDEEPLIVKVDERGRYYLNLGAAPNDPVDSDTLAEQVEKILRRNPNMQVLVAGSKDVNYGAVVEVMALLKRAGAPAVGLLTEPPREAARR